MYVRLMTLLLLAMNAPILAGEPQPPAEGAKPTKKVQNVEDLIDTVPVGELDAAVILQSGEIKIPLSSVEKVELAYVAAAKRQNPKYILAPELRTTLRKSFAFRFLANAVVEKYVADNKIELSKEQFEEQFKKFKKAKAEEGNSGSYEQWLADNGLSDEEFRRFWAANWAIEQNFAKSVTDADVEENIKTQTDNMGLRRASHILVMNKGPEPPQEGILRSKEEAKARAEEALKKLKDGEEFVKLVRAYSDCPSKADKGALGYVARKAGPTAFFGDAFNAAVYALEKPGDTTSAPVESAFGYHIIRLDEVRKPEEMKKEMRQFLISEKYRKQMEQLMNAAAANAKFNAKHL
ncbi:MAG TPA: peptidylprolyl isomerase [Planctomycetota bacterium]|nr:peptidylprolyl isomerase [Planctomycetota bacterium]